MRSRSFPLLVWTVCLAVLLGNCRPSAIAADSPPQVYATPEAAQADPDFAVQGEYTGKELGLQAVALGRGKFQVVVWRGGLPGAGWNGSQKQVSEEDTAELQQTIRDLELKKVNRQSKTLGAKPPAGAVVLFDGTEESLKRHWKSGAKRSADELLEQGVTSTDTFADFTIHIEFRTPYMPLARGQGRGNSGLYYQGRFETQMLDSFGLEGKDNECGGIYSIKDPDLNMCFPPLTWQTYDADFTAARYDQDGKKIANARVTVRHNGVIIHDQVELPRITTAAPNSESPAPGPIYLQDHGNPVRYRNIWVLPRDAVQEAARPIAPVFERFHGANLGDNPEGGKLLLGELNCLSCHETSPEFAADIATRKAPALDSIGTRVHPEWLVDYLQNPRGVKVGTTMPHMMHALPDAERKRVGLALAHFLASTGSLEQRSSDEQSIQRGRNLFHQIGCVACHAPIEGPGATPKPMENNATAVDPGALSSLKATSIPLGDLSGKYSIPSLSSFLENPHVARPSGRMPRLVQNPEEARDLANYLVGKTVVRPRNPNFIYTVYHGSWDKVPDFDKHKAVTTGESAGLNVDLAGRANDFGMRFNGFLRIQKEGKYTFHIGSDDGSLLFIDGKRIADSDGVHPHQVHSGAVELAVGMHPIRVDYTQVGGGATLTLELEGPGIARQDANGWIFLTKDGPPPPKPEEMGFQVNPQLAEQGKALFVSTGCVNCHAMKIQDQQLAPVVKGPHLSEVNSTKGCLAPASEISPRSANYQLSPVQRLAIASALSSASGSRTTANKSPIEQTMMTLNCYACHSRGGMGGPDKHRNPLFLTSIPEMGDEGRIPPPLDGVGDKLRDDWLKQVLDNGSKDRPYMLTRMPRFASPEVGQLTPHFITEDRRAEKPVPPPPETEARAAAVGRHLAGDKALGCIKCHAFGPHATPGIRGLDLQTMTRRVREDWFHRYMVDPALYRPGTRMPTGFPEGKATVRDVYDGDPSRQLAALWTWLKQGGQAGLPEGLVGNMIELRPEGRPVIYRNFLEGVSPRGIAVGYPERANIAWDANRLGLVLAWHGRFIDAGKHWEGRGPGNQGPLGDHVIRLDDAFPFAQLEDVKSVWPTVSPRENGWKFKRYVLDADGRPHFHFASAQFSVEDFPAPIAQDKDPGLRRTLTIQSANASAPLWFRAATGKIKQIDATTFQIDTDYRLKLPGSKPVLRESAGKQEVLVPIEFRDRRAEIIQEIDW